MQGFAGVATSDTSDSKYTSTDVNSHTLISGGATTTGSSNFVTASSGSHSHTISGDIDDFDGNSGSSGSHTHTITGSTSSAGSHTHTLSGSVSTYSGSTGSGGDGAETSEEGAHTHTLNGSVSSYSGSTGNIGSGSAHNNMPPYLVVYMWQRTA